MVTLIFMFCAIFVPVFSPSLPVLSLGEVLQGIPWVGCSIKCFTNKSLTLYCRAFFKR